MNISNYKSVRAILHPVAANDLISHTNPDPLKSHAPFGCLRQRLGNLSNIRLDVDRSSLSLPSASASPKRHLGAQDSWLAVEPGLRIAVDALLVAKDTIVSLPAGPEGTEFGLYVEADLEDIEFDLEDMGFQNKAPGAVRPGSASLAGLNNRPERLSDCNFRDWAAEYRLALLLLPLACQPLRSSLADRSWERVQWWHQLFAI